MSVFRESIGETLVFEGEKPYAEPAPNSEATGGRAGSSLRNWLGVLVTCDGKGCELVASSLFPTRNIKALGK